MSNKSPSEYLVSYKTLRSIIGAIGILLFVIPLIYGATQGHLLPSISLSYYSPLRNFFVGSLCVLGMFLISYHGYDRLDSGITNVAGVCAVVVGFCPTRSLSTAPQTVANHIHPIAAGLAFAALAIMALQFTQAGDSDLRVSAVLCRLGAAAIYRFPKAAGSTRSFRNYFYVTCAWIIALSMALVPFAVISLFWPEAFMMTAFGLSWTVKGETILRAQQALKRTVAAPQRAQV